MVNMYKIILIFIFCVICFFTGYYIGNKKYINNNIDIQPIDTSYNKIILDSIQYNIIKKDSTIIKIKKKFEYEKNKAINASDSDAIKQFTILSISE